MAQNRMRHLGSMLSKTMAGRNPRPADRQRKRRRPAIDLLESRELLSTFTVTNLHAAGAGSLRQAIIQSNNQPGFNTIDFSVHGTIDTGSKSLPAITSPVRIDGTSAPLYNGSPVVTVDFQGTRGLMFAQGSDGSILRSLALVHAGSSGVTLLSSYVTVQGNDIGVLANGSTPAGNQGDGIRIMSSSHGDLIGQPDPVTGVTYYNTGSVSIQPVTDWTGIRASGTPQQYLLTGTSGATGLLYAGPISGSGGTTYVVSYPGASVTSPYGPDVATGGEIRVVGTYKTSTSDNVNGFVFQGTTADLASGAGSYQTINYPGNIYTYVHSTMGDLAVGNAGNAPGTSDVAFIYSLSQQKFLATVAYPGAATTSVYGVWSNGNSSYTLAGGFTSPVGSAGAISEAYLVDYNESTGQFSNWMSYAGPQGLVTPSIATHFQGISSPVEGVYTLAAFSTNTGQGTAIEASLATVKRSASGTFTPAYWVPLSVPGAVGVESANSVADNQVVGIATTSSGTIAYQATVNLGFQLSNVISGNKGNGIGIDGASGNTIVMNNIGTDSTGSFAVPNGRNGILLTQGASGNMIGGIATAGNDPTAGYIARPPQGNLISGNRGDGVLMTAGATGNTMSGNFVGTTATGDSALGNGGDGVAIVHANGNQLIGCQFQDSPFVYYNVVSGNGGNGLRITDSNNTVVQANFLGAGANNMTVVPNGGDGLLVSGTSANTQVGGVIPLGNVISGNARNGIEVKDQASGLISFNTFTGIFAFGAAAPNRLDGVKITSTGGGNIIRTCIVSGNGANGIEIGGQATGVQVTDTAVGTNTGINVPIPNAGDGIKIDGHAHNNAIGGFQPSVEPNVDVSANYGYGIEVAGHAHDNAIFHCTIGASGVSEHPLGNGLGGIVIGAGTSGTTVGGPAFPLQDAILYNNGPGILIHASRANAVLGNQIQSSDGAGVMVIGRSNGTRVQSNYISGNTSNGVVLLRARGVSIGGPVNLQPIARPYFGMGNQIVTNSGYGVIALGASYGTVVQDNFIMANTTGDVNITHARGITYIPRIVR